MNDAVARRHHVDVLEGFLAPVDEVEAVGIASVLDGAVVRKGLRVVATAFDGQRMVDDQLHRNRRVHRVGPMYPGDEIVFVGVTSAHRGMAFEANEFIMDHLKTRAPFWKREATEEGDRWVDARDSDKQAAARW